MSSKGSWPKLPRQFSGRWNKAAYQVLAELGKGANGAVYLADCGGSRRAVKIGPDAIDLLMEVNMLKSVQGVRDIRVGPKLCDVDDVIIDGKSYTFYAMEYLEGERLDRYVKSAGTEWVPVLMVQLLSRLDVLHRHGWVFGDLKPENVIVCKSDKQVRLIDFGGVTKIGSAVRQFTEEYDRAAWQAGDRRAEISYDLFSLAVMMTRLMCGDEEWKSLKREPRQTGLLCGIIRKNDDLYPYRATLVKAFHGKIPSAAAMKLELLAVLRERMFEKAERQASGAAGKWIGGLFVASLLALAGSLYYAWM